MHIGKDKGVLVGLWSECILDCDWNMLMLIACPPKCPRVTSLLPLADSPLPRRSPYATCTTAHHYLP